MSKLTGYCAETAGVGLRDDCAQFLREHSGTFRYGKFRRNYGFGAGPEAGYDAQADALENGVVTFDEYSAAFQGLASSLNEAGFLVTPPIMSPVSGTAYKYGTNLGLEAAEQALLPMTDCEASRWNSVAALFSLSRPQVTEEM